MFATKVMTSYLLRHKQPAVCAIVTQRLERVMWCLAELFKSSKKSKEK